MYGNFGPFKLGSNLAVSPLNLQFSIFNSISSDGLAAIYPGDDYYPIHPDYEGLTKGQNEVFTKNMSLEEFSKNSENRNRMERRSMYDNVINCNIEDPCGHRFPI